jgi:hypothetical protein
MAENASAPVSALGSGRTRVEKVQDACRRHKVPGLLGFAILTLIFLPLELGLTDHWRQICWGTLAFVVGSAMAVLTDKWKEHRVLRWARVLVTPLVLALAAVLTTYGWNLRSAYMRDEALLIAAASEWKLNDLRNAEIESFVDRLRATGYTKKKLFSIPTSGQLSQLVNMAHLTRKKSDGSRFQMTVLAYVTGVDEIRTRLAYLNGYDFRDPEFYRSEVEGCFSDPNMFPRYLKAHRLVEKALRARQPRLLEQVDWLQFRVGGEKPDPSETREGGA